MKLQGDHGRRFNILSIHIFQLMLKKIYTTAIALTFLFYLKIIIQHSLENSFITSGVSSLYKFSVVAICVKYGHLSGLKLNISATCAVVTVSSVNDSYLVSS